MEITNQRRTAKSPASRVGVKVLLGVAAAAVLLGVFALYADPQFVITMADQLWACF
ncbi:hypothetical protein [Diaphorobacter aerolatus]|uniref:Uncharacterized protein n=1 Tax=Diaphorobacter aerolatus TaxID=1288495 RepID=A0A7H0GQW7_9BURK|nr:hypothetical protein [Diaphorobacter aerolatus]QNP50683.1 hypothetical protein H9K75_18855 [Diaphorobacter aerolatus]